MGKIFSYLLRMLSFLFISSILTRKINEINEEEGLNNEGLTTLQQIKVNADKTTAAIKKYCDDYPDDEICKPGYFNEPSKNQGFKANWD
ncbi:MAG: hypothetical protein IPG55_16500 [Saprospiraceae bacterium]|nr:hypothetical protein [Candidatus Defluviibacterium haderslevense]